MLLRWAAIAVGVMLALWVEWELIRSAVAHGTRDARDNSSRSVLATLALWAGIAIALLLLIAFFTR